MAIVLATLLIGVTNLWLGYAAAAYLGYAPPSLSDAIGSLTVSLPFRAASTDTTDVAGASDVAESSQHEPPVEGIEALARLEPESMLDDEDETESTPSFGAEPTPEIHGKVFNDSNHGLTDESVGAIQSIDPESPDAWEMADKGPETSLLKLDVVMFKSGMRAAEIDAQLRMFRAHPDAETLPRCLRRFQEDCRAYIEEQTDLAETFHTQLDAIEQPDDLAQTARSLKQANLKHTAEVAEVLEILGTLSPETKAQEACERMSRQVTRMRVCRHALRDRLDVGMVAIARHEKRLEHLDPHLFRDARTGVASRLGLEARLHQWWMKEENKKAAVVLLDLDGFGRVNDKHGILAADRVLTQLVRLLRSNAGTADVLGRFADDRFALILIGAAPSHAIGTAETVRQNLQHTTFLHGPSRFQVTLTAGVSRVLAEDRPEDLWQRLDAGLDEAIAAGGNQSWLFDDSRWERIEPEDLGAEEVEIEI